MSERNAAVARLLWRSTGHKHTTYTSSMVKRINTKKVNISTESIDLKSKHSAKTNQSWKYANNKIVRAPSKLLGGRTYTDPKDTSEPRRKQESNFFICINTNMQFDDASQNELAEKQLKETLNTLSRDINIAVYLKFGPKDPTYIHDKYSDVIHSVDWMAGVETGPKKNRLHAHIWTTITHYSQIQINVHLLMHETKKIFNAIGPFKIKKMPYVNVKLLPQSDWTEVMRQYIHKAMANC